MPRTKRSRLAPVTDQDRELLPDQLRPTPNGGWAWKCHYCGRYACDRSVKGLYLCRCHGGSTPRQRSPVERARRRLAGQPRLRMPGRPLKHGRYARLPGIKIDVLIAEANERRGALNERMQKQMEREGKAFEREVRRARR